MGRVEISTDNGKNWSTLLTVSGRQDMWGEQEIPLDEYCGEDAPSARIRWYAPSEEGHYWTIDNITLINNDIVAVSKTKAPVPEDGLTALYPNPANGVVTIAYHLQQQGELTLFDTNGRQVDRYSLSPHVNELTIKVDTLPTGVYLVKLSSGGAAGIRRLVILK